MRLSQVSLKRSRVTSSEMSTSLCTSPGALTVSAFFLSRDQSRERYRRSRLRSSRPWPSAMVRTMSPASLGLSSLEMSRRRSRSPCLQAAGDADAAAAGHVHQVAPGQRDLGAQPRALVAHRVLGDLHQHLLAVLERVGDAPGALLAVRRRHLVHVQEAVLLEAEVDERRVDAVHDVLDLALVDVAQVRLAVGPLDVDLGQAAVLDQRDAQLVAVVGDEDDLALGPLGDDASVRRCPSSIGAWCRGRCPRPDGRWPLGRRRSRGRPLVLVSRTRRLAGLGLGRSLAAGIRRLGLAGLKSLCGCPRELLRACRACDARAPPRDRRRLAPFSPGSRFSGFAGRAALGGFLAALRRPSAPAPAAAAASGASAWASPVAGSPAASSASRAASSCSMSELLRRRRPPRLPRCGGAWRELSSPSPSWRGALRRQRLPPAADSAAASGAAAALGGLGRCRRRGCCGRSHAEAYAGGRGSRRRSCRRADSVAPSRPAGCCRGGAAPSRSRRALRRLLSRASGCLGGADRRRLLGCRRQPPRGADDPAPTGHQRRRGQLERRRR